MYLHFARNFGVPVLKVFKEILNKATYLLYFTEKQQENDSTSQEVDDDNQQTNSTSERNFHLFIFLL